MQFDACQTNPPALEFYSVRQSVIGGIHVFIDYIGGGYFEIF